MELLHIMESNRYMNQKVRVIECLHAYNINTIESIGPYLYESRCLVMHDLYGF